MLTNPAAASSFGFELTLKNWSSGVPSVEIMDRAKGIVWYVDTVATRMAILSAKALGRNRLEVTFPLAIDYPPRGAKFVLSVENEQVRSWLQNVYSFNEFRTSAYLVEGAFSRGLHS